MYTHWYIFLGKIYTPALCHQCGLPHFCTKAGDAKLLGMKAQQKGEMKHP